MTSRILIVGFACLSAVAVAQSDQSQQKTATQSQATGSQQVTSPRDIATGQASGKRMHKPMPTLTSADDSSNKVTPAVVKSKPEANDDWQTSSKSSNPTSTPSNDQPRVAAGDVNGDGRADAAARNSGHATETLKSNTPSTVTQPRDVATGQATGKRQHQPLPIRKEVEATSPQK